VKILLVYPQIPETFWSFKHALKFVSKKVAFPPLGLLTVAAMLPDAWEKKLVDMNAATLSDKDLSWADYVFISAMAVQQDSAKEVINRCKKFETKIVAGGPLFSAGYEEFGFDDIDHLILSEAEDILPLFIEDLEKGCAKQIYASEERPNITKTPVPLWSLIDKKKYHSMSIQYSRGCPFNCEFCDIVIMNGHIPRTKDKDQIITELEALYNGGWRDGVFFVDDNFIGNKRKLKSEILPAMAEWMEEKKHPFSLFTEASINLADDEGLMRSMSEAGFETVFVGIESPNEESLIECNKLPNGVLMAPPGTRLYKRLKNENRLLPGGSGDNTDGSTNFVPKMGYERLANGYKHVLDTIYSPKPYYERIKTFLREYNPRTMRKSNMSPRHILALIRCMWVVGVREKGRMHYWKFFAWTLLKKPKSFALSITFAVQGFHFRKVAEKIQAPQIKQFHGLEQAKS
jgi:radical SAM superfamily enzyme YgiQ (UPF0313 family)